jgi:hypothetical protein
MSTVDPDGITDVEVDALRDHQAHEREVVPLDREKDRSDPTNRPSFGSAPSSSR